MSEQEKEKPSFGYAFFRWMDLSGLAIAGSSLFAFLLLFGLDALAPTGNPYVGILAYLVAPVFMIFGMGLMALSWLLRRRQILKQKLAEAKPLLTFDLSQRRDRRALLVFVFGVTVMLLLTAVGSYRSYHFTESTTFCGQSCHTVMKPEMVTYQNSPHARVSCVECHIGPGATWYVRSKLSGLYQVYATMWDKFPRPIPTPIENLRPAQDTCEQCHWPQKFVGNLDRTYVHYLTDETNTPYAVRLSLKVGGGDPTHGPVSGIHWHMNVGHKVEYIATDEKKQTIPWVRVTDRQGVVTVYKTKTFEGDPKQQIVHVMDCMDCHNRPSHNFQTPNDAVDISIALGRLDRSLPFIKKNATEILVRPYAAEEEAMQKIATSLHELYPGHAKLREIIDDVQRIYRDNFFPEMKANWKVYPDNIGHKDWPGCFRCHDGEHKAEDGKRSLSASGCNACHIILAQGQTEEVTSLTPQGEPFKHPGDPYEEGSLCSDCHSGGP